MIEWQGTYCGAPPTPVELMSRWNFDPVALLLLVAFACWAGRSRAGFAGIVILAAVYVSPLCCCRFWG